MDPDEKFERAMQLLERHSYDQIAEYCRELKENDG